MSCGLASRTSSLVAKWAPSPASASAALPSASLEEQRMLGPLLVSKTLGNTVWHLSMQATVYSSRVCPGTPCVRHGPACETHRIKACSPCADAYDRRTLLATTIAAMLFPEADWRRAGESDARFADRTRGMLQKQYLTPLRAAAMLPEVSAGVVTFCSFSK